MLKKLSSLGIIFLLLASALLAFIPYTDQAQGSPNGDGAEWWTGTVYIRADGSIDPPDAPIQRDGNLYRLTGNIKSSGHGIVVERDGIVIDGARHMLRATETKEGYAGIYLSGRKNVTIKKIITRFFYHGIYLANSSNNTISRNIIYAWDGISLANSSNNIVSGNSIPYNGLTGILIGANSSNNIISGNNITRMTYGIEIVFTSNNIISGNNIADLSWKGTAIHLLNTPNNIISGNNITDVFIAFDLFGASNNIISGNNIENNGNGICLWHSSNNIIFHNNFIDNLRQVIIKGHTRNVWDDGYPSGGNYWSDYNGTDSNNDGIGDTPYVIDKENVDRYPLMKPVPVKVVLYRRRPSVILAPYYQSATAGLTLNYTIIIRNNDPPTFGPSKFSISCSIPPGWRASLSTKYAVIHPGRSASVKLSITPPKDAEPGNYTISVTATNMNDTRYSASAEAVVNIQLKKKTRMSYLGVILSGSARGRIVVPQSPPLIDLGRLFIPSGVNVNLVVGGVLVADSVKLSGKTVELYINDNFIGTSVTDEQGLSRFHTRMMLSCGECAVATIRFPGDEQYPEASTSFKILGFKSCGFNITRDAYSFRNWDFTRQEFRDFAYWIYKEYRILPDLITSLYILTSLGGHCFGMAYTSSAYFLEILDRPRNIDVYALRKEEALHMIQIYQTAQYYFRAEYGEKLSALDAFKRIKELIDAGIPPVVGYGKHAVTIMGYYEGEDGRYLIVYDNRYPDNALIWRVADKHIVVWEATDKGIREHKYEKVEVIKPVGELKSPYDVIVGALKLIYKELVGLVVHSPVDVVIKSNRGEVLRVVSDRVVENTIEGSYVHVARDVKEFLLPSDRDYNIEITGREKYKLNVDLIQTVEDELTVSSCENIEIKKGSKLTMTVYRKKPLEKISIDVDGDGAIDATLKPVVSTPLKAEPPTIKIISPISGAKIEKDTVKVKWRAEAGTYDITKIEIRLDKRSWIDVTRLDSYTFTGLTEGKHVVAIRAVDEAGNTAEDIVEFYIELPKPQPAILSIGYLIAAVAVIVAVAIIIIARRKRR